MSSHESKVVSFPGACPLPDSGRGHVQLAHGGGGALMQRLLQESILPALGSHAGNDQHDAAILHNGHSRLAFTTDSFVVQPRFFPGGDIGSLAVHGTLNDLAMAGARPLALSAALILEEGCPMQELDQVLASMRAAADAAGVPIVTGDTKVVDRGKGDGLYINTSGIGLVPDGVDIRPARVVDGDVVLVSGDIGRHGIAIMACREGLEFETVIESDSASLAGLVAALLEAGIDIHCLRDLTRGGLTAVLNEIAAASGLGIEIEESRLPIADDIAGACELLGLDPACVACEGRLAAFVPAVQAERALEIMRAHPLGANACDIGRVGGGTAGRVILNSRVGARRLLDMPSGEQLPRIC